MFKMNKKIKGRNRKRKGETTLLAKTEQVICSFTFNIWQIADVRSQK